MKIHYKAGLPLLFILVISKCCTHAALTSKNSSVDYDYKDDYDDDDDDYYSEYIKTVEAQTEAPTRLIPSSIGEELIATGTNALHLLIDIPKRSNHVLDLTCPKACLCFKDYKIIQCSDAGLNEVPTDIPQTATHINLSQNYISKLRPTDFSNCSKLLEIDLSGNHLTEIPKDIFLNNKKLERLNLAGNYLTTIDPDTFSNVKDLAKLDLSNNTVKLPASGSFLNQPGLLELTCQNCSWTQLYDETFKNLSSLTALRLDRNDFNKKINTKAFIPLRSLIKLRLPELDQQSVIELCSLLKSIDNISFSHFGVSCYELVLGTSFNESLILATDPLSNETIASIANNKMMNLSNTESSTSWPDILDKSSNITLSSETNATLAAAGIGVPSTSSTAKNDDDHDSSYQVPVSQETINIMLISIMVLALVGLLIGIICRKDIGGIKTKCCRTNKAEPKEDVQPAEEIPLNKLA